MISGEGSGTGGGHGFIPSQQYHNPDPLVCLIGPEFGITFPKTKRNTVKQYVETLHRCLQWAYEIAKEHIAQDVNRRKLYYDRQVNCMEIVPGDIVLVKHKVFGTQHKIEDHE